MESLCGNLPLAAGDEMMNKQIWIGGGLGVLVLALMAGSFWMADRTANEAVPASSSGRVSLGTNPPQPTAMPGAPSLGEQTPQAIPSAQLNASSAVSKSTLTIKERRARLAQLRSELNTLRGQGANASPAKMRALVDELESLSVSMDKRYFDALRSMLENNAKVLTLSAELESLSKSKAPKDVARQQVLLTEMRAIGEQVQRDAQAMQIYAASVAAGARKP